MSYPVYFAAGERLFHASPRCEEIRRRPIFQVARTKAQRAHKWPCLDCFKFPLR